MWITPGLLGLMPMVLLVFANPNRNTAVEKQSLFSDTTLKEFLNRILTAALDSAQNVHKVKITIIYQKIIALKIFINIVA